MGNRNSRPSGGVWMRPDTTSGPMVHVRPLTRRVRQSVSDFLDGHRDFLTDYVINWVPLNEVEGWMIMKLMDGSTFRSSGAFHYRAETKLMLRQTFLDILTTMGDEPSEHTIYAEVARCIAITVEANYCRVFKVFPQQPRFLKFFTLDKDDLTPSEKRLARANMTQVTMVRRAIELKATLRMSRADDPDKFPNFPPTTSGARNVETNYVQYQPLLNGEGEVCCVVETWRQNPLTPEEESMSTTAMLWGSIVICITEKFKNKRRERTNTAFLLDILKTLLEDMVSLDQLTRRIVELSQKLVDAERASIFFVDNQELVSTVFDLNAPGPSHGKEVGRKEIRLPINRGICGHVAVSGETMNIPDAYNHHRFNREVDEKAGYKTVNMLCMPIKVHGNTIAVVQMVNKLDADSFSSDDERSFKLFSNFFGLALRQSELYEKALQEKQKYEVASEVLGYHDTCTEEEVRKLAQATVQVVGLNDFYFSPYALGEFEKCRAVITMFDDLFDISKFDLTAVYRFILTVKKNYRKVPYHNFDHGWSVAHAMYVILKNDDLNRFSYRARLALFVACLCHDMDHRGYSNTYMSGIVSPLAAMYSTPTSPEIHHFYITVKILQEDGHNIFSNMSSEDYEEIMHWIRRAMLATDLETFYANLEKMMDLQVCNSFEWDDSSHRDLAMEIAMTAADLSAVAKPWKIQMKTVDIVFAELYDQGERERAVGSSPILMMDRNNPHEKPSSQIGFLMQFCVPCYYMLSKILPHTLPLYQRTLINLQNWEFQAYQAQLNCKDDSVEAESSLEVVSALDLTENTESYLEPDLFTTEQFGDPTLEEVTWEEKEEMEPLESEKKIVDLGNAVEGVPLYVDNEDLSKGSDSV